MQKMWVQSLGSKVPLEEEMMTHFKILAWEFPWTLGAWWATVHRATKSQTWLSNWKTTTDNISQMTVYLLPKGYLAISGGLFFFFFFSLSKVRSEAVAIFIKWENSRNAAKDSMVLRSTPWAKELSGLNVNCAEVKKAVLKEWTLY